MGNSDFDEIDLQSLKLAVESGKVLPSQYGYGSAKEFIEHIDDCWNNGKKDLLNCYLVDYRFSYDFI